MDQTNISHLVRNSENSDDSLNSFSNSENNTYRQHNFNPQLADLSHYYRQGSDGEIRVANSSDSEVLNREKVMREFNPNRYTGENVPWEVHHITQLYNTFLKTPEAIADKLERYLVRCIRCSNETIPELFVSGKMRDIIERGCVLMRIYYHP
uniref:Translation initiation factor IF-2 n=1 Tax=Lygus hesperus TaxID=30085 RepID=A0A0A9Z5W9_LYGHE